MKDCSSARPILKWPGGKIWLAPHLKKILEIELVPSGTYYEPFMGAGAIFFCLLPKRAVLSDINLELVEFFQCVRDHYDAVIRKVWRCTNTSECYYHIRKMKPETKIGKAVRFLFLNRTCWGGIYRLNKNGEFNVPFGNSGRIICRRENVVKTAIALKRATLLCADFQQAISRAGKGDVIYADPPYTTLGQGNGFLRYNEKLFRWSDQLRLADSCLCAKKRGAFVAVSNLWHDEVLQLFPGWWAWKIERQSLVCRKSEARHAIFEVVIFSRKPECKLNGIYRL